MDEKLLEQIMGIIAHSGETKSEAHEAIKLARQGKFEQAENRIELSSQAAVKAHNYQTKLLTSEANNEDVSFSLLLVHAQDHLMTSMTYQEIAEELIHVYKSILKE